jgi:hypothetical protein
VGEEFLILDFGRWEMGDGRWEMGDGEGILNFEFLLLNVGFGGKKNERLMNVDF